MWSHTVDEFTVNDKNDRNHVNVYLKKNTKKIKTIENFYRMYDKMNVKHVNGQLSVLVWL